MCEHCKHPTTPQEIIDEAHRRAYQIIKALRHAADLYDGVNEDKRRDALDTANVIETRILKSSRRTTAGS